MIGSFQALRHTTRGSVLGSIMRMQELVSVCGFVSLGTFIEQFLDIGSELDVSW